MTSSKTIYLDTLGCRLNESEIEHIGRDFKALGHSLTQTPEEADICVFNTCAVTQEASRKSRQMLYQTHRKAPHAQLVVTGCYSEIDKAKVAAIPGVTHVISNLEKEQLPYLILGISPQVFDQEPILRTNAQQVAHTSQTLFPSSTTDTSRSLQANAVHTRSASPSPLEKIRKTRAFVKVQDGCNNKCAFCVTTLARGSERSRNLDEILCEIRGFHKLGHQEIVLTGVHLGAYGRDQNHHQEDLKTLLQAILTYTDIPRIRLSSLEPWDLPEDFFSLWSNPRLCQHLHLPLQSGCDQTLKRMMRRTRKASFRAIVEDARAHLPKLSLSTDMIVGFPGETEAEFEETLAYVEEIEFFHMHIFRYSPRPQTRAATMPNQLPKHIKKQRSQALLAIDQRAKQRFHERSVGQISPVLWEKQVDQNEQGILWQGLTDNYIRTQVRVPRMLYNKILDVELTSIHPEDSEVMVGHLH
ncbi:MAG: tRNA (N(6)-L-threonylcarbamoyladenosine(37)-C(2))-methylthiotransferase MtaB [Myxococcota bacterium]